MRSCGRSLVMLRCASLRDSRPRIIRAAARCVRLKGSATSSWLSREKASLNSCSTTPKAAEKAKHRNRVDECKSEWAYDPSIACVHADGRCASPAWAVGKHATAAPAGLPAAHLSSPASSSSRQSDDSRHNSLPGRCCVVLTAPPRPGVRPEAPARTAGNACAGKGPAQ